MSINADRLQKQIAFILEIDKLKSVYRRTYLLSGERNENSAEHSWQVALMVNVLAEHAGQPVDVSRVTLMLLLHDIVEIDAGDVFAYDSVGMTTKLANENAAADRIFSILPEDQELEFRTLWEEFEAGISSDAKFAVSLDRLIPELNNMYSSRSAWIDHNITLDQILDRNKIIAQGSSVLWDFALELFHDAFKRDSSESKLSTV
jgi:putative hydrolase of HD superfamily